MAELDLSKFVTETRNPRSMELDTMSPLEICTLMNSEDENVIKGVREVLPEIASTVEMAIESYSSGHRIIYIGAGSSGRFGIMDAVECMPTFGVEQDTFVGLLAGGMKAFKKAVEGAEDRPELGEADLKEIDCRSGDLVIGIAASGRTPYVIGALDYARSIGCHTAAIACNKGSAVGQHADVAIEPVNGPEVLTGSTRLKAGTSQKLICNMISTATMVRCGKVYQNLMVDVQQTNEKLVKRAENIIMAATGCDRETAVSARINSDGHVKTAVVMVLLGCDKKHAEEQLAKADGHVREAIK